MRADCLFLVCLALVARPVLSADDVTLEDGSVSAPSSSSSSSPSSAASVSEETVKEGEMLDVAESSNNNTAAADEDGEGAGSTTSSRNTKRTIDHNLGYGYRYNTVLRPVHPMHHFHHQATATPFARRPTSPVAVYKLQPRFPHHFYSTGTSGSGGGAPFRYSQPLPSPPQRDEVHAEPTMSPRPVTEAPSGPHAEAVVTGLYRTLPQQAEPSQAFAYEDDLPKAKPEPEQTTGDSSAQPVQYADESPAHSYQQVLHAEPTYILTSATTAPAATAMLGASTLAAMYGHGLGHAGHPVMYTTAASGSPHATATQMIPVIIVRLMDSQAAAATLTPMGHHHTMSSVSHAITPMAHTAVPAVPYSLVSMQFLRDYLSKLYAPTAAAAATQSTQYADADTLMYSSPLFSSTQLQKLQIQQQLHAHLQKQLQQQQQHRQSPASVAAILQEQHRQRVAAAQGRTEVTVQRSPAMSPQDYKESVEQQEDA